MKYILLSTSILSILALLILIGCATKRWSETDPRYTDPDTSNMVIDDSMQIGIGTGVSK